MQKNDVKSKYWCKKWCKKGKIGVKNDVKSTIGVKNDVRKQKLV